MLASKNKGYFGAILEPTYGMIKRVLIPTITAILKQIKLPYTLTKSEGSLVLHFPDHDAVIYLLAAENYQRAAGLTLAYFLCDEFDLIEPNIAEESWKMMCSRLTGGNVVQGCVVSTPEGFRAMYKIFVEKENTNTRLIRARTKDNPFIRPEYIDMLMTQFPQAQLRAYLDGEFVNLTQGNVYYNFDRTLHHTDRTLQSFKPNSIIHCGLDFNVGNSTIVTYVIEDGKLYIVDEVTGIKNTEEMIRVLKQKYAGREIRVYPDAAGGQAHTNASLSDIALLKQAGLQVYHNNKNPRVRDRVNSVISKLMDGNGNISLYINTTQCKSVSKGLEQQTYDSKTGAPDKTMGLDHSLDAMGYVISYLYPVTGRSTITSY